MKLTGEFVYLSSEQRTGVKDPSKKYNIALFMQGTETLETMVNDLAFAEFSNLKQYGTVSLVLDYNARYQSLKVAEIIHADKKQANHS